MLTDDARERIAAATEAGTVRARQAAGLSNGGLAPRRWQPRPAMRDDLPFNVPPHRANLATVTFTVAGTARLSTKDSAIVRRAFSQFVELVQVHGISLRHDTAIVVELDSEPHDAV